MTEIGIGAGRGQLRLRLYERGSKGLVRRNFNTSPLPPMTCQPAPPKNMPKVQMLSVFGPDAPLSVASHLSWVSSDPLAMVNVNAFEHKTPQGCFFTE
jgi:hypothetical protein